MVSLTAKEAREMDLKMREEFGIPTLVLMENAGRAVAVEARRMLKKNKRAAIFCGKGNNGGDGLVASRHLLAQGVKTDIFLFASESDIRDEARVNLEILLKLGQRVTLPGEGDLRRIRNRMPRYGLIIDALLGVGLSGEVRGDYRTAIEIINAMKDTPVLSVDIPSGLDATTGEMLGSCVRADETVTFIARKRGMTVKDGPGVCGKIVVRDLGFPFNRIS